jgi:hypothetical protein
MNQQTKQPAFPCVPLQDSLGRFIAPISGMNKLEYFAIKIYCSLKNPVMSDCIKLAEEYIDLIDKHLTNEPTENKPESKLIKL